MPRRSKPSGDPTQKLADLQSLIRDFDKHLASRNLRQRVQAFVPIVYQTRDLGCSLLGRPDVKSARSRILAYLQTFPNVIIGGGELLVVAGIDDWARRVRELRVEHGWKILSGIAAKRMESEEEVPADNRDASKMKVDDYILVDPVQDRDAVFRWKLANEIRNRDTSVQSRILEYLRKNVGKPVLGDELIYVAKGHTEWARRTRELRTEQGWSIVTKANGRPDLPVGVYVLESDRRAPEHDRKIPDPVRRRVLVRDNYQCQNCGWSHAQENPSDRRHLEAHHLTHHVNKGSNTEENLVTLCNVCHDEVHAGKLTL